MRDWEAFVRSHLDLPAMTDRRDQRIIGELAAHAEEVFREARERGATEVAAEALALATLGTREEALPELLHAERLHAAAEAGRRAEHAEDVLREKGYPWARLADLATEFRLTWRSLARRPLFSAFVVLTLALGIGASTAIFTLLNSVILSPLPFRDPGRLVLLDHLASDAADDHAGQCAAWHYTYEDENRVFQSLAMYASRLVTITGDGDPEAIEALVATNGLFRTLGLNAALGRALSPGDEDPSGEQVVLLGFGYWRSRFGGDSAVLGRRLLVNGTARRVVGVAPPEISALGADLKLVVPLQVPRAGLFVGNIGFQGVARLRDGVTSAQAEADMARMLPLAFEKFPGGPVFEAMQARHYVPLVRPLRDFLVGRATTLLWVFMAGVGLVLLIACANVANLLLVRADARGQEMAVRAALGASRGRIAWEHLKESLVLCALGCLAGVGLAAAGVRALVATSSGRIPRLDEVALDARPLVFAAAVSLAAALVFAALPTFRFWGRNVVAPQKQGGGPAAHGRHRRHTQQALAVGQITLAVVALVAAGLVFRSTRSLLHREPGFGHADDVLAFRVTIRAHMVRDADDAALMQEAIARSVGEIPGVRSVGMGTALPMGPGGNVNPLYVEGVTGPGGAAPATRRHRWVGGGYFETLGIPLLAGRTLTWQDAHDRAPAAVVSRTLALAYWGSVDAAIGKRIAARPDPPRWYEVVGVVGDAREDGLAEDPNPLVYWPQVTLAFGQGEPADAVLIWGAVSYVARSDRVGTPGFLDDVRRAVWSVRPDLPLTQVGTMDSFVTRSVDRLLFARALLGIAALVAVFLGLVGVYAVMSYTVSQRTAELGMRMVLGAEVGQVRRMVLRQGLVVAAVGVGVGFVLSLGVTRLLSSLLYDVSATDPLTFGLVAVGLTAAALAASFVPAYRASRVDPMVVLRSE